MIFEAIFNAIFENDEKTHCIFRNGIEFYHYQKNHDGKREISKEMFPERASGLGNLILFKFKKTCLSFHQCRNWGILKSFMKKKIHPTKKNSKELS